MSWVHVVGGLASAVWLAQQAYQNQEQGGPALLFVLGVGLAHAYHEWGDKNWIRLQHYKDKSRKLADRVQFSY